MKTSSKSPRSTPHSVGRKPLEHLTTEPLVVRLEDPGMTPLLRAGLGGIAASVRAIASNTGQTWPGNVNVGKGQIRVQRAFVEIDWNGAPPAQTLKPLFDASFRIDHLGLIELPGTYGTAPPSPEVAASIQRGLKRTFLQHGKSTSKKTDGEKVVSIEVDDRSATFSYQPYARFVHQDAVEDVIKAVGGQQVRLAGWAHPGAVARHIAVKATELQYDAPRALCACFAIVGCISVQVPRTGGGALVVPEPTDLVRFARTRPRLSPRTLEDTYIAGAADGVLAAHLALRIDAVADQERGVGAVIGIQLKSLPWASQQKSRSGIVKSATFSSDELDRYDRLRKSLPTRVRVQQKDREAFGSTSALRAFLTENLSYHRPWYAGFADATDGGKEGRKIHYFRDARERANLGALFPYEREGLIAMLNELEPAEASLVRAIHQAIRSRFGAIAEETSGNPTLRKKRWQNERDRWRYAFSGSKTHEQIREALADLWSRAGRNRELQERWVEILPLLRPARWRTARDLSLVALASYRGELAGDEGDRDEPEAESMMEG